MAPTREKVTPVHLGCKGHCIIADQCRYGRHTQVGSFRISTIGNYYHSGKRQTLGGDEDSFFETFVFKTLKTLDKGSEGCGCRTVKSWSEIDAKRYATAGGAQAGHEAFIKKYLKKARA